MKVLHLKKEIFFTGISEKNFNNLMNHAQIPKKEQDMITNLKHLGCNIIDEVRIQNY